MGHPPAAVCTGWERHFQSKEPAGWGTFDKGVHTVELNLPVKRVEEGVAEQHKWSKPFKASVSQKLIPPSLIPDITCGKSHRYPTPYFVLQTGCECGFYQPTDGCGAACQWVLASVLALHFLNWILGMGLADKVTNGFLLSSFKGGRNEPDQQNEEGRNRMQNL